VLVMSSHVGLRRPLPMLATLPFLCSEGGRFGGGFCIGPAASGLNVSRGW